MMTSLGKVPLFPYNQTGMLVRKYITQNKSRAQNNLSDGKQQIGEKPKAARKSKLHQDTLAVSVCSQFTPQH